MIKDDKIPPAEDIITEFKREWSETAKGTFCSFLNTSGGRVFFGVADDGKVVGVDDPDLVIRSAVSVFRHAMHPNASRQCRARTITVEGRAVVVVDVLEGDEPPYYVTVANADGKKERRCYLRHGSGNYQVNDEELRKLYQKGDPTPYESRVSSEQNLSFEKAEKYFSAAHVDFSEAKYGILGMTNRSGFYTNLAFWLSDQCTAETRVGFFAGPDKASPSGGIVTFTGCILEQYQRIRTLLNNRFGFSYEIAAFDLRRDGTRHEVKDYPEEALREALANAFAHRDFAIPAAATVTCFSDRIELMSFGGLLPEADLDLLRLGASISRNPKLAELLMRLSAMEKYGIGIPLMYSSYAPYSLEPKLTSFPRALLIVLPKITLHPENLTDIEKRVLDYLRTYGPSKREAIQTSLEKSYGLVIGTLNDMMRRGIIEREGGGRNTRYRVR